MKTAKSRRLKIAIGAVVAIVLIAVVAPFVYINFIEGDPPETLSVNETTNSTVAAANEAATASLDGTWNVAEGSTAGYRVPETLFGQQIEAVGRTSEVTGSMTLNGTQVQTASFVVDVASVTSDQNNRDNQFRTRIMNVTQYPTATFALKSPIQLSSVPAENETVTATGQGTFTIHGVTRDVAVDLTAKRTGNAIQVNATIPVTFSDYNIDNPSFGPAVVGDTGTMEVLLNFTKA